MSEQYPLLCDDLSEEERFRRLSMSKGRVRNHVKGAAAIIIRWPGHWTTLLTYWWIAVGMIAITTFLIYNSLFSCALPQPAYQMPHKPINIDANKHLTLPQLTPKVFMHIFINDKEQINLNDYVPYIEIIANTYKNFEYELLIVANDTNAKRYWSDEENNEMALNSLWEDDFSSKRLLRSTRNLKIKYVTMSNYLNESPLKKYWKDLPYQFIKFLIRAVSIWDKGGIAFDPVVLTPQSPHSIYIDKIQSILSKYKNKKVLRKPANVIQQTPRKQASKFMPKVNNILDIINALESEEINDKSNQETLAVAETKYDVMSTLKGGRKLLYAIENKALTENITKNLGSKTTYSVDSNDLKLNHEIILRKETIKSKEKGDDSHKLSLLSLFLDYLFHNKQTKHEVETTTDDLPHQENKDALHKANLKTKVNSTVQKKEFSDKIRNQDIYYRPMIISAHGLLNDSGKDVTSAKIPKLEDDKLFEVTVDLKGNIIATDIACHAFVGSLFTNAIHHEHGESVTDFIIKELSIFCKGLLTSCMGIDVILL